MTRNEYLESKNQQKIKQLDEPDNFHPRFVSLEDYLAARRKCEEYEQHVDISGQLTSEDYEAFDKNFENALNDILYKDEDLEPDDVDKTIEMMEAVDWTWANGKDEAPSVPDRDRFIDLIRYCYEQCFHGGHPKGGCGTGGIYVETDIMDHFVKITFSSIDAFAFDGDDRC